MAPETLLIAPHRLNGGLKRQPRNPDRKAGCRDDRLNPRDIGVCQVPEATRKIRSEHKPAADRLTVQPRAVTGELFNGVTECVTEIQFGAFALFFFISGDDAGLNLAGSSRATTDAFRRQEPAITEASAS